jgi:hypothetical protein
MLCKPGEPVEHDCEVLVGCTEQHGFLYTNSEAKARNRGNHTLTEHAEGTHWTGTTKTIEGDTFCRKA